MPGGEADLELSAGLDNQQVIKAIEEMDVSAQKFLLDADTRMQRLGMQTLQTAKTLETQRQEALKTGRTFNVMFQQGQISLSEFRKHVVALGGDIKQVADEAKDFSVGADPSGEFFKDLPKIELDELIDTGSALAKMEELEQVATRLMKSTSAAARHEGAVIAASLEVIGNAKKPIAEVDKDLNKLIGTTNKTAKRFDELGKKEIFGKVNVKKVEGRFHELEQTIKTLKESTSTAAQSMGKELEAAAVKTKAAWTSGERKIEDVEKDVRSLNATGKETNRIYGDKLVRATNRSTVSIGKMSSAMSQMGVRGAGGALRVVDAIRGIHPAAIVAVVGVLAIGKAIQVITKLAISFAKKVSKAFIELTKDSLELAKSYEVVELQLRNIFRGKVQLARATLTKIMDLGAELGVDLSERLTQVFLPLVENFAQFEELARGAATLAAKTGKSIDETGRAFQQAVAGQFRALQYQFFVTADQIDNIKEKQEELGATEGLIAGMNDYFEASGTGWDTFEDSLRRVQGQLTETFNLFKFQLGEPVKIALTEQLVGIREWVDDNQDMLKGFFREIGEAIATVVTALGEWTRDFLDDIQQQKLDTIAANFKALAESIAQLFSNTSSSDARNLVDTLVDLSFVFSTIVLDLKTIYHLIGGLSGLAFGGVGVLLTGAKAAHNIDRIKEERGELEKLRDDLLLEMAIRDALGNQATKNLDDQIDQGLALNSNIEERNVLLKKEAELYEEISDAYGDFGTDVTRDLRDLEVEAGRKEADILIDNSREREKIYRDHTKNILNIGLKAARALRDHAVDAGRKEDDIAKKDARKRIEIDIEENKKKEELERKHQDRLSKIRDKYEFDAREAIRQNDAVALFKLRRKLEFDLLQENKKHDDSVDDATDAAKDKRSKLDRQLQYEEEDLSESNRRKIEDIGRTIIEELAMNRKKRDDLLAEQDIAEQLKQENYEKWLQREREDFNTMLRDKLADLKDNMADITQEYQDTLADIQAINASIVTTMFQGLQGIIGQFPGSGLFGSFMPPQIQGLFGGGAGGVAGIGGIGGAPVGVPGSVVGPQQRALAVDLAQQLYSGQELIDQLYSIGNMQHSELSQHILWMQNQLNPGGHSGGSQTTYTPGISHQHGGIENVGVASRVGEAGPEARIPAQHGIIAPSAPFMMPSQAQPNISNTTDNSRNISASIDMTDPTQASEIQKTLWRSFVTEQLLAIEGGG